MSTKHEWLARAEAGDLDAGGKEKLALDLFEKLAIAYLQSGPSLGPNIHTAGMLDKAVKEIFNAVSELFGLE